MRIAGLFVAMSFAFAAPLGASDIAVVVDVSGTMARYGVWQSDAVALIDALLAGNSIANTSFTSTGEAAAAAQFKLAPGEGIQVLRFGSLQTDAFPFFTPPQRLANLSELRASFPMEPSEYRQSHTNKELAIAVAARLIAHPPARLVAISDFLVDADVSQQQQQFVNEFQSQAKLQTPLIFNWITDSRVMVKLIVASWSPTGGEREHSTTPESQSRVSTHQVQILEARQLDGSPPRIQFRWRIVPAAPAKSFRIAIRDTNSRRVVHEQAGLAVPSLAIPKPDPGNYLAVVTADFADGSQAISRPYPVKVEGNSGVIFFVFIALLVLMGGLWWLLRRANRRATGRRDKKEVED